MTKEVKRIIFVVLFCEFLICLGMSLILPVEPFIKNEYHFTAFDMGVMSSLFAFVQFIASPIVGRISDKVGRKPMLVWGLLIFAIAEFVFALAQHLWLFDLSRAVDGLSAAMFVPTSMALAADITSEKDRAKVFVMIRQIGAIGSPGSCLRWKDFLQAEDCTFDTLLKLYRSVHLP